MPSRRGFATLLPAAVLHALAAPAGAQCEITSLYSGGGAATAVETFGGYAYAGRGESLVVLDISDPDSPEQITELDLGRPASEMAISGHLLLVVTNRTPLLIFDLTDPAAPFLTGQYEAGGTAFSVGADGPLVCVCTYAGLETIDLSDPTRPRSRGIAPVGQFRRLAVSGDVAIGGEIPWGWTVFDLSDPLSPKAAGQFGYFIGQSDAVIRDGTAYVADESGALLLMDVSDPYAPKLLGDYLLDEGSPRAVALSGNVAFLAAARHGLLAIDTSDPGQPVLLGEVDTPGDATGIVLAGGKAIIADSDAGVRIADIADPSHPALRGVHEVTGSASHVSIAGTLAAAGGTGGVTLFDTADPAAPRPLSRYGSAGQTVLLDPPLLFVSDGPGLDVVDVSDPASPGRLGRYDGSPYGIDAIARTGDTICGVRAYYGLVLIDISDPASPRRLGEFDAAGAAPQVAAEGDLALVNETYVGVRVIDISNPASPVLRSTIGQPEEIMGVALRGGYAYAASGGRGLVIYDLTDPADPRVLGEADLTSVAHGVSLGASTAYVTTGSGVSVVDVSNPAAPFEVYWYPLRSEVAWSPDLGHTIESAGYIAGGAGPGGFVTFSFGAHALEQPADARTCKDREASFRFRLAGDGVQIPQWRKDGAPLHDGPTGTGSVIAGAATGTLRVQNPGKADQGVYDCVVVTICGEVPSHPARLTACRADCTCDARLTVNDFICYQSEWRGRTAYGDYTGDGKWNVNDFIAFQADFRRGCP